jgi:hypothetical protein
MSRGTRRLLEGLVGLSLVLAIGWFAHLRPDRKVAEALGPRLPELPRWQPGEADSARALPEAPAPAALADFLAEADARFAARLPDRWRLALIEGRLDGPEGALALARATGLPVSDPVRQGLLRALAVEVSERARKNDFAGAETLLAALLPEEAAAGGIPEARELLAGRLARWQADPERARHITESVAAAEAALAEASPASLAAALAHIGALRALDPEHGAVASLGAAVRQLARSAWQAALAAGDWPAIERWSAWAERHLPEGERRELAAATRAARDRRAAPSPGPAE